MTETESTETAIIDNPVRTIINVQKQHIEITEDFYVFPAHMGTEQPTDNDIYGESIESVMISHKNLVGQNIAILAISPIIHSEKVLDDGEFINIVIGDVKGNLFTMPVYGILKENLSDYRQNHETEIDKNGQLNRAYLVRIMKKQSGSDSSREYYYFASWDR
ncbi:unnamed protein product [marine sediment metagenome]|uniref:Uncharacterized protein n=1 Tax=marine sediment metagenome TaxID=412755 RepID=X0VDT0_9ZZZZ